MTTNHVTKYGGGQCDQTTIVCRIRNRNEIFADSIQNWLRFSVSEIIIVDFRDDGCQSVWNVVKEIDDQRIKVIETKYEYMFLPTIAWNLGLSQATSEYIFMLDVDNILHDHFFEMNVLGGTEFICGKPVHHIWGSCLCRKASIDVVNGFNENCLYMGHGDTDLFNRMVAAGYSMQTFAAHTLYHKEHVKDLTICNQIRQKSGDATKLWFQMMHLNRTLSSELVWTTDSPRTRWNLEKLEPRRWLAIRDVVSR